MKVINFFIFTISILGFTGYNNIFSASRGSSDIAKAIKESVKTALAEQEKRDLDAAIAASLISGVPVKKAPAAIAEEKKIKEEGDNKFTILPVFAQKGLDCLFHAIKNGFWIREWKSGRVDKKACCERINTANPIYFPLETWRARVFAKYSIKTNLDGLSGIFIAKELLKLRDEDFNIIPDLISSKVTCITRDPSLAKTIKEFRSLDRKTHIFFLGNMSLSSPTTCGHWVSIVVHKENGKFYYYGTDSGASPKLSAFFNELHNIVEKVPVT